VSLRIRDLPHGKLLSVGPDATLAEVAKRMRLEDCDSVAVMADKRLLGIITERDLNAKYRIGSSVTRARPVS